MKDWQSLMLDAVDVYDLDVVIGSDAPKPIKDYAAKRKDAMGLRLSGNIQAALKLEEEMDQIYNKLPQALKW